MTRLTSHAWAAVALGLMLVITPTAACGRDGNNGPIADKASTSTTVTTMTERTDTTIQPTPTEPISFSAAGQGDFAEVTVAGEVTFPEDGEGNDRLRIDYTLTNGTDQPVAVGEAVSKTGSGASSGSPDPGNAWILRFLTTKAERDDPESVPPTVGKYPYAPQNPAGNAEDIGAGPPLYLVRVDPGARHDSSIELDWPLLHAHSPSKKRPEIRQPVEKFFFSLYVEPFADLEAREEPWEVLVHGPAGDTDQGGRTWYEVPMGYLSSGSQHHLTGEVSLT